MTKGDLDHFFNPSSIAVVGASRKRDSLGNLIVRNLIEQGFSGSIYPVNPKSEKVAGLKCYKDVAALPAAPDLSVIAIPARFVPQEISKEASLGVRNAIIVSAGFKEIGAEGKKLEDEVKQTARRKKVRVLGPNCLGIYDNVSKIDTFFVPRNFVKRPSFGGVSLASQSGSFIGHVMDIAAFENLGIARVVTYGNQADVNEEDALVYFEGDSFTKVVGLYIEAVRDGKAFVKAARRCAKKKPVIVLKTGRSDSMSQAVTSHTGAIAGQYSSYKSAFQSADLKEVF